MQPFPDFRHRLFQYPVPSWVTRKSRMVLGAALWAVIGIPVALAFPPAAQLGGVAERAAAGFAGGAVVGAAAGLIGWHLGHFLRRHSLGLLFGLRWEVDLALGGAVVWGILGAIGATYSDRT